MLYQRHKREKEVVSVLNDVDFCIELMESNRINVAYIMNLIRNINFDDPIQKDYDIKHIISRISSSKNDGLTPSEYNRLFLNDEELVDYCINDTSLCTSGNPQFVKSSLLFFIIERLPLMLKYKMFSSDRKSVV